MEYQYFSKYCIEVRNSSFVTCAGINILADTTAKLIIILESIMADNNNKITKFV